MFLLAITKNGISQDFGSKKVEELNIHSLIGTVIIDKFLSDFISESDSFSILESPLVGSSKIHDIFFSKINFQNNERKITVYKPFHSGRPVFYHINSKGEFFCSSHITMLRKAGVTIAENSSSLPEFFIYRYVIPPKTLYKNIKQLIPGSKLNIKISNDRCKIINVKKFNPFSINSNELSNIDIIVNNVKRLLNESINNLNPKKDRLSVLLSGGIDSSILFKLCQQHFNINQSYSTGYPLDNLDINTEKKYALTAAEVFDSSHSYYSDTMESYLEAIIEGISKAEEPFNRLQSAMIYLLFKNGLPIDKNVVISGYGADGIFGDVYQRYLFLSERLFKIMKIQFFFFFF